MLFALTCATSGVMRGSVASSGAPPGAPGTPAAKAAGTRTVGGCAVTVTVCRQPSARCGLASPAEGAVETCACAAAASGRTSNEANSVRMRQVLGNCDGRRGVRLRSRGPDREGRCYLPSRVLRRTPPRAGWIRGRADDLAPGELHIDPGAPGPLIAFLRDELVRAVLLRAEVLDEIPNSPGQANCQRPYEEGGLGAEPPARHPATRLVPPGADTWNS